MHVLRDMPRCSEADPQRAAFLHVHMSTSVSDLDLTLAVLVFLGGEGLHPQVTAYSCTGSLLEQVSKG